MSAELADVDTSSLQSSGPSIRDSLESAVAAHTGSPDVDRVVAGAVEQRDTELRRRDREQRPGTRDWQAEASEQRRAHVRDAVNQHRVNASQAASAPQPTTPGEVPAPGAPMSWDSTAKAHYDSLPQEVRLAIQRDHASFKSAHDVKFQEFERVLAPARQVYSQQGLKDHEAVATLFQWEQRFRNPETRLQAFHQLAQQYGVDLGGGQQQHQPQQYQSNPQEVAAADQRLGKFAQGRTNFEQVRESMGLILQRHPDRYLQPDGNVNLDALYTAACKVEGIGDRPAPRELAPPRPRAPVAQDTSVRQSLKAALRR